MELGSSRCGKPLQHGKGLLPCSSGSTCLVNNRPEGCRVGTLTGKTNSMESSKSRQPSHRSLILFVCGGPGLSRRVSHQLWTKPGERYHRGCGKNLVEEQMSGGHSVVDCGRYRSLHHEESRPVCELVQSIALMSCGLLSWQSAMP